MTDELLPYYDRELAYLRKLGAEFAAAHPKIAGRLRMSEGRVEDPHVSRMIEASAYLNARTRRKIDDDFPEITEGLMGILYPHYLAPFPSAAIVQFTLDRGQAGLTDGYAVDRGALIETEQIDGEPCRFRTCYPVTAWPLELDSAGYHGHPLRAPPIRFSNDANAVIHLELTTFDQETPINQLSLSSLRFFLEGDTRYIYDLYEGLLNDVVGVAIASSPDDADRVLLGPECLQPVGFERDQGLLEYSSRSFLGYRLLTEYFVFPEKFLFVDLTGLNPRVLSRLGDDPRMHVFIYLRRHAPDLERNVRADTFRLGCCPMVNVFRQRAEPIHATHTQTEYRIVPDARRPQAHEIYTVDRVTAVSSSNEEEEYLPFFSIKHGGETDPRRRYWHATRRAAGYAGGEVDDGTEVYLTLVNLDFDPTAAEDWTIMVETTCLNRDLPSRLPFGGGQPHLQLSSGGPFERVSCITPPRKTFRPALRRGTIWRLISHLSLNYISLVDSDDGADALREILSLYDLADSPHTRDLIEGLLSVESRRIVGRAGAAAAGGFCRGLEVTLHFDEEKYSGSGVFLFAEVLERFLGLYSSMNSFTKTIATTNRRERPLREWPPRAGEMVLL